jgi:hypothetical protein
MSGENGATEKRREGELQEEKTRQKRIDRMGEWVGPAPEFQLPAR